MHRSPVGRFFKGLSGAKRYCANGSNSERVVQPVSLPRLRDTSESQRLLLGRNPPPAKNS